MSLRIGAALGPGIWREPSSGQTLTVQNHAVVQRGGAGFGVLRKIVHPPCSDLADRVELEPVTLYWLDAGELQRVARDPQLVLSGLH